MMTSLPNKHYNARPQRKRKIKEHLEKRSGERCADRTFQVELEQDGGASTRRELDGDEWSVVEMTIGMGFPMGMGIPWEWDRD